MSQEIQFVKNEAEFSQLLATKKYLVANFTASWCGPCRASKPAVDALYADAKYQKIEIVRVDLDGCPEVASKYNITSVPTFVFFEASKEVERKRGFSPEIKTAMDKLSERAATDSSVKDRDNQGLIGDSGTSAEYVAEITKFIPKGFAAINGSIHFGDMVALNVMPLYKKNTDSRSVFRPETANGTVYSDADSQALFFVPLNHICKVYSILIKTSSPKASEDTQLDEEELSDETQSPTVVKVWANKPAVLSFEDCTASDALHEEKLQSDLEPGWHEVKLRYVRFQNVQNLNIFIDGADEDSHTIIDKIVVVGLTGESTEHIAIQQDEE
ncbi:hypothetical protein JCM33374_g4983 [Metschnikowia sp. JCM 33374]|nr:hypothetical protein JCM33374_g4983 [Metschnikowia sp. JCM 33374]